jgi:hypothetical protein
MVCQLILEGRGRERDRIIYMFSNSIYVVYLISRMKKERGAFLSLGAVVLLSTLAWALTEDNSASVHSRQLAAYLTSSTRNQAVASTCSGYSRSDFIVTGNVSMSSYVGSINSSIGIDGYLRHYEACS